MSRSLAQFLKFPLGDCLYTKAFKKNSAWRKILPLLKMRNPLFSVLNQGLQRQSSQSSRSKRRPRLRETPRKMCFVFLVTIFHRALFTPQLICYYNVLSLFLYYLSCLPIHLFMQFESLIYTIISISFFFLYRTIPHYLWCNIRISFTEDNFHFTFLNPMPLKKKWPGRLWTIIKSHEWHHW